LPKIGPILLAPEESILRREGPFTVEEQLNCHPNVAFHHLGAYFVTKKYLLPCRCGQQHVVEPRHAGGSIPCSCGEVLPIPTLIEMTALETAPDESLSPSVSTWGVKQRMAFLGMVIILAAIGLGALVYKNRPIPASDLIDPEKIQQRANELTPLQSWGVWEGLKRQGLGRTDTLYADELIKFRIWLGITIVLALSGGVLMAIGFSPSKPQQNASGRPFTRD
jgi:hypothetical protein